VGGFLEKDHRSRAAAVRSDRRDINPPGSAKGEVVGGIFQIEKDSSLDPLRLRASPATSADERGGVIFSRSSCAGRQLNPPRGPASGTWGGGISGERPSIASGCCEIRSDRIEETAEHDAPARLHKRQEQPPIGRGWPAAAEPVIPIASSISPRVNPNSSG
jgi:hypothetical protein